MSIEKRLLLECFDITPGQAVIITRVANGRYTAEQLIEVFPACEQLDRQCYTTPDYDYLECTALNSLLDMHGCEELNPQNSTEFGLYGAGSHTYLNAGDSYAPTLIRSNKDGVWHIGCIGDVLEGESVIWE
jgi:hypothetical protein